jgi:hypothetical protein
MEIKSIVLINCYFGPFPWYFNLFLKSCEKNPTINIFIFTDNKIDIKHPNNIRFIPFSLVLFNKLATEKLGFKINIEKPYKLCDFKPAYGEIFQDFIKTFDFWGITDIDIVFGRIREFMNKEVLDEYDVISVRDDDTTGFFMLFRNIENVNSLFRKSKDYKLVFTSNEHYCFDECNFKHFELSHGEDIINLDCSIESFHHVVKLNNGTNIKAYYDFHVIEGMPGKLKWNRGILTYKNEFEALLYHLISYKANHYSRRIVFRKVPKVFLIDKYLIKKHKYSGSIYNLTIVLKQIVTSIEFYFYKYIYREYLKGVAPNIYKYAYGSEFQNLIVDNNQINYISSDYEMNKAKLAVSFFNNNILFIEKSKMVRIKLLKNDENIVIGLNFIFMDGTTAPYNIKD